MKLFGWMHHKKRQNNIEPLKDISFGNYCTCLSAHSVLDDQDYHSMPSFGSRCISRTSKQPKQEYKNSISELEAKGVEENFDEETSVVISELFHGFLTIGTLGSEPITNEPATPTFAMSVGNITEEKTEVTKNDLKLINEELEKFLLAEAEEENNEPSGRNSYVSIITLSDKTAEGTNAGDDENNLVCPLQGYLFGSSVEFPETMIEVKERVSLAELFHMTKITDENSMEQCGKGDMPVKRTHKSIKHLIKKKLKKFLASSKSPVPSSSDTDSVSTKKKLHKVIQMFHRKIHPEHTKVEKEFIKSHKNETDSNLYVGGYVDGGLMHSDKDNKTFTQASKSKKETQYCKTNIKFPQYGLSGSSSSGCKEHWIKTDADYLVLEL